jgi:hypothetical protein
MQGVYQVVLGRESWKLNLLSKGFGAATTKSMSQYIDSRE